MYLKNQNAVTVVRASLHVELDEAQRSDSTNTSINAEGPHVPTGWVAQQPRDSGHYYSYLADEETKFSGVR